MRWYFPSWHGDLRLVPHPKDDGRTLLQIEKPTPDEQRIVNAIGEACVRHGWLPSWEPFAATKGLFATSTWEIEIGASVATLGPTVKALMKPGPSVLTAIKISDGQMITASGGAAELQAALGDAYRTSTPPETKPGSTKTKPAKAEPEAAATVRRPTPCCPQCEPGSIGPASEVLLTFLTPEQHETWAKRRLIVVTGGLTGQRYMIAHRHTPEAQRVGRVCFDLDDNCVVHFHDRTVPPEEEVLAAKLILEHREPWLRNQATMLGHGRSIFDNPFGDLMDGVEDATFTQAVGRMLGAGWG